MVVVAHRRWSGRGRGGAEEAFEATVVLLLPSTHSWPEWVRLEDNFSLFFLFSSSSLSLWLLGSGKGHGLGEGLEVELVCGGLV